MDFQKKNQKTADFVGRFYNCHSFFKKMMSFDTFFNKDTQIILSKTTDLIFFKINIHFLQ